MQPSVIVILSRMVLKVWSGLVLNIDGMGDAAMVPVVFLTFCMFRDDNARQRVTLIFEICKTSDMCFTLHIFRNIKVILIWN